MVFVSWAQALSGVTLLLHFQSGDINPVGLQPWFISQLQEVGSVSRSAWKGQSQRRNHLSVCVWLKAFTFFISGPPRNDWRVHPPYYVFNVVTEIRLLPDSVRLYFKVLAEPLSALWWVHWPTSQSQEAPLIGHSRESFVPAGFSLNALWSNCFYIYFLYNNHKTCPHLKWR